MDFKSILRTFLKIILPLAFGCLLLWFLYRKMDIRGAKMMGISKKLETIYHNGQPDGIRSMRRSLSTMTTYVIPRPLLGEAKDISGIKRPGIYYLINEDEDNNIARRATVSSGWTTITAPRISGTRRLCFWQRAGRLLWI